MKWQHAELLWLLALVPLGAGVLVMGWRLRGRALARFGAATGVSLLVGRAPGLRALRAVVLLMGLALAIVALARPQYGSRTKLLRKRGVDVVVVLDFSKSMLAQDVRPSRIERAKAELTRFISELAGDRIGIVAFAGETMEFPMTTDYAAAALFFRELVPGDMPVGGTAIGRALTAAKRLLERSTRAADVGDKRERIVVLMTDGEDHEGDPVAAAKELADMGAKVFAVAVGSRTGEPIPTYADDGTWTGYLRGADGSPVVSMLSNEGEAKLREVAETTGGKYFEARRGSVGMDEIRAEMRRMKQTELESRRVTVHEERYALVLLVAFLLLVLESLLPEGWVRREAA